MPPAFSTRMIQSIPLLDARVHIHIFLTGIMAGFSYIMALPQQTMIGPNWAPFRALLPSEPQWSIAFGLAAVIGVVGFFTSDRWLRLICTFLLSSAHASMALLWWAAHVDPDRTIVPAVITYALCAYLGMVLFMRRLVDAIIYGY